MCSRKLRSQKSNMVENDRCQDEMQPKAKTKYVDNGIRAQNVPAEIVPEQTLIPNASASMPPPSDRPLAHAIRRRPFDVLSKDEIARSRSTSSNRSKASIIRKRWLELEVAAEKRKMALDEDEANVKLRMIAAKRAREEIIMEKLQEIFAYDMMISDEEDDEKSEIAPSSVDVERWVEKHFGPHLNSETPNEEIPNEQTNQQNVNCRAPPTGQEMETNEKRKPVPITPTLLHDTVPSGPVNFGTNRNQDPETFDTACMERFLARQTVGTKLPPFSGNSHEWPMFLSQFQHSTKVCGLTDHENMLRLQESLRGKAKETVESILGFPENVGMVLEILKMNFGRHDQIIRSLISKARTTASPKDERPETIISFYNAVNNMVSMMQRLKSDAFLNNPSLLEELVQKLSPHLKANWAMHVFEQNGNNHIMLFASWLKRLAISQSYLPISDDTTREDKNWKKAAGTVMSTATYDDDSSSTDNNETTPATFACVYCRLPNHSIGQCRKFKNLSVDERWKFATLNRCCFLCLQKGHITRDCQLNIKCSHNGCTCSHNALLHNTKKRSNDESWTNR